MSIPEPVLNEDFYMVKLIGGDVILPTPRTRFEELLYIYAGGTIERPTPKTVEERFLDYLTGGASELPTPKTRLQSYMYNVANPSNKIPVVPPKTRFECYWFVLATANAIISTDNPVEFTSLDGFLLDYTIWGNTEQDLSEIDITNAFVDGNSISAQTGLPIYNGQRTATLKPVTLMAGTYNIYFSGNVEGLACRYSIMDADTLTTPVKDIRTSPFSITLTDNYFVYFALYSNEAKVSVDALNSVTITTSDGQICPSPDYQFDVKGVGNYSTNKYIISLLSTGQENSQSATNSIVLDEPLHAIDNYADSVNYISQKERRNVKKLVVDGTDIKFSFAVTGSYRHAALLVVNPIYGTKVWSNIAVFGSETSSGLAMRNKFTVRTGRLADTIGIYLFSPKTYVNIVSPTEAQLVNFFNNKAQELYNNGTPIIFYYVSATNEESTAELPKIQTYAPKTELTVDTEVDPSKIEVVTRTE